MGMQEILLMYGKPEKRMPTEAPKRATGLMQSR